MYTWGYGGLGGHPGVEMSRTPQRLPRQLFGGDKLTHIDCGINHFAAITSKAIKIGCFSGRRAGLFSSQK